MSAINENSGIANKLQANSLGVFDVVFLVLAAAAPLTSIIVMACLGIALGNGGGMVGSFLLITFALLMFGIGYAQMSRDIVNAGGFYTFVLNGLGRPSAMATALTAMLGYNFFVAGAVGTSGFFMAITVNPWLGIDIPWLAWSIISVIAAFLCSNKGIGFSAKILGVALVFEILILLIFDFTVLLKNGFSFHVFKLEYIFTGGMGLGLLFAANCFVGVEATGLFSEEAKDPQKTIPRSIYISIIFIGMFSAFTTWAIISAIGVSTAKNSAMAHLETGDLVFSLSQIYLGSAITLIMQVLLLISLFAALMALHNSATRYIYALARAHILPHTLSKTHDNGTPRRASILQFSFGVLIALVFAIAGMDPISTLVPAMTGLGALGIITLQCMAALAIIVYFRRKKSKKILTTFIAPVLGFCGLMTILITAILNFPTMAGSDSQIIGFLPVLLIAAIILGYIYAFYLKRKRPSIYSNLSSDLDHVELPHN